MFCHYNGQTVPLETLSIPVQDRGFIFGDGIYEVVAVYRRKMFGGRAHVRRLLRSLNEVSIGSPYDEDGWLALIQSVVDANPWPDQSVYLQVTRGVSPRDFAYPRVSPTVFAMSRELVLPSRSTLDLGVKAVSSAIHRSTSAWLGPAFRLPVGEGYRYAVAKLESGSRTPSLGRQGSSSASPSTRSSRLWSAVTCKPRPRRTALMSFSAACCR